MWRPGENIDHFCDMKLCKILDFGYCYMMKWSRRFLFLVLKAAIQ